MTFQGKIIYNNTLCFMPEFSNRWEVVLVQWLIGLLSLESSLFLYQSMMLPMIKKIQVELNNDKRGVEFFDD